MTMTMTDFIDEMFDGEDGPSIAYAPTGEPYITYSRRGKTETMVTLAWLEDFCRRHQSWQGKLWWRTRPTIDREFPDGPYQMTARYLITDREPCQDYLERKGRFQFLDAWPGSAAA